MSPFYGNQTQAPGSDEWLNEYLARFEALQDFLGPQEQPPPQFGPDRMIPFPSHGKTPRLFSRHQDVGEIPLLFDNPDQVPDRERFRLGGNRVAALRGYADYSVVPEGNSPYLGGRTMGSGTVECIYGVNNSIQIIIPFFDFGGTWNSLSESDFTTLRRSVGFGARIEVPMMGVMGFDWGYPLDPSGSEKGRFHFKMGTDF